MDRIRNLMILCLVLPLIGSIAVGCDSGTEEPAPPMPEAGQSDSTTGGASEGGDESVSTAFDPERFPELRAGVTAEVPKNLPVDLPIYPGAAPAQGRSVTREGVEMAAVQLLTNDPPSEAFEFYQRELESSGWSIDKAEDMGKNAAISASKQDCKVTLLFSPSEDGGTDIFTVSECGDKT